MIPKDLRGSFGESPRGTWLENSPFSWVLQGGSFNRIISGLSRPDFSPKGQGMLGCLLISLAGCAAVGLLEMIAQNAGVNFGLATATLEATRVLASATPMSHAFATATPEALATATKVVEHGASSGLRIGAGVLGVLILIAGGLVVFSVLNHVFTND